MCTLESTWKVPFIKILQYRYKKYNVILKSGRGLLQYLNLISICVVTGTYYPCLLAFCSYGYRLEHSYTVVGLVSIACPKHSTSASLFKSFFSLLKPSIYSVSLVAFVSPVAARIRYW